MAILTDPVEQFSDAEPVPVVPTTAVRPRLPLPPRPIPPVTVRREMRESGSPSEGSPVEPLPVAATTTSIRMAMSRVWWINQGEAERRDLINAWSILFEQMNELGDPKARADSREVLLHIAELRDNDHRLAEKK